MTTVITHYEDEAEDVRRHAKLQGWSVYDPNDGPTPPGAE